MNVSKNPHDPFYFFSKTKTGEIARAIDWSRTFLGPAENWPQELKTILGMIYNNRQPMCLFWGDNSFYFYNDSYIPIVGEAKHPWAIGREGKEVWGEIWEHLLPQINQVMNTGEATWNEDQYLPIIGNDGKIRDAYFTYSYSPIFLSNGEIGATLVTCTETTNRIKSKLALKKSEESLKLALTSAQMGTWELDPATGNVHWSQRTNELFGVDPMDDFPLENALKRIHPEDIRKVREAITTALDPKGSGEYKIEYRVENNDGHYKWLSLMGQAYYSSSDNERKTTLFSGVVFDITKTKQTEAELRDAVIARDQFLSIASHELKTPITSIKMQIQMAQRSINLEKNIVPSADKLSNIFAISTRQVNRLVSLIDELLDVTRIGVKKLNFNYEEFNFTELILEICNRYNQEINNSHCTLSLELDENVFGSWDRFRMEQVITNLLSNAIKYGSGKPIEIKLTHDNQNAKFVVVDHGIGISSDAQLKIFDRFERAATSKNISGLGLGLFITKEIITALEGSISVDSELHKGSIFTVIVPIKPFNH